MNIYRNCKIRVTDTTTITRRYNTRNKRYRRFAITSHSEFISAALSFSRKDYLYSSNIPCERLTRTCPFDKRMVIISNVNVDSLSNFWRHMQRSLRKNKTKTYYKNIHTYIIISRADLVGILVGVQSSPSLTPNCILMGNDS